MKRSIHRRNFIKLISAAGIGFYLSGCKETTSENSKTDASSRNKIDSTSNTIDSTSFAKKEQFSFQKIEQTSEIYQQHVGGFNKNIKHSPKIIVLCENENQVADVIKYATQENLTIGVKSGGHCFEGLHGLDYQVLIDFSKLKEIELKGENVLVGSGVLLRELNEYLLPKGRIVPAGSCGGVGIGGLTLGGGYGLFARQFGLTCDYLVSATFIDGNGKIYKNTNDENLLWALRGGGNGNFGIVTNFEFKTLKSPKSMTSVFFKSKNLIASEAKEKLATWISLAQALPNSCYSAFVLNGSHLQILLTYTDIIESKIIAFIKEIEKISDTTTKGEAKGLLEAIKRFQGVQHPIYLKIASTGLFNTIDELNPHAEELLDMVINKKLIYQVNTMGGMITDAAFEAKSSYPHRPYLFISEIQAYWENNIEASKKIEQVKSIQAIISKTNITAHYRNYPDIDFENFEEKYYGKYLKRLKEVKAIYDPQDRIKHKQSITL